MRDETTEELERRIKRVVRDGDMYGVTSALAALRELRRRADEADSMRETLTVAGLDYELRTTPQIM